jgi:sulfatase-like protein
VAAAQEAEPRHALRATSLLAVLILAKSLSLLLLRDGFGWSAWGPIAYFWQDVLVVLIFHAIDRLLGRPLVAWTAYAALAVYAAINVPITAVLASPLTRTLARASGGALADSIAHYVTLPNLAGLLLPLVAAVVLPVMLARTTGQMSPALRWAGLVAAVSVVAAGPLATARTETLGLHRNVLVALAPVLRPIAGAAADDPDVRRSPFPAGPQDDLTALAGAARGRNVVLIALESTAARYLGLYGADADPTPVVTALARHSLVFDRAYAVYPESIKGLFATLCSRYPVFDSAPDIYASLPCDALPARLASQGYRTALFHSGRFDYLGMRSIIDGRGYALLEDAGAIGGNVRSSFGVDELSAVRRMLEWIDEPPSTAPFFLTYLPVAGHHPYPTTRPGPFAGDRDYDRYLNALHEGDEAIGVLLDGLRERGLDRNTLFVVFGDHGEAFGQHPGNYAHTLFIYEENVHVPLVVAAPGLLRGERRITRTASVVDLAPTILHLLGASIPRSYAGTSLLDPSPRMALFFTDYSLGWLGLRDGCWKYLLEVDADRARLYDVCRDREERDDVASQFPDRARAYHARVAGWERSALKN